MGYDLIEPHLDRQQPQALQGDVRMAMQAIGQTITTSQPDTVYQLVLGDIVNYIQENAIERS